LHISYDGYPHKQRSFAIFEQLAFFGKGQIENVEFFMTNYFKVILNVIHNNKIKTRRHPEYSGSGRGEGVST
jgi:hypothetical protein